LTVDATPYQGKVLARLGDSIYLMQRDGRLRHLKTTEVTSFRKLSDQFEPFSAAEMRDALRREFRDLEVIGTGNYLVAGTARTVRDVAQIFEDQYRAIRSYFSVRGFDLPEPEFPLVAIVFPDHGTFAKNAASNGFRAAPGLRGFYLPASNRISMFQGQPIAAIQPNGSHRLLSNVLPGDQILTADSASIYHRITRRSKLVCDSDATWGTLPWASTEGDLEATMIHEATHQVAFNVGIHNRVSNANPRWLVEGLATTFEAPGMRSTSLQKVPGAKLNQSRLSHFREFFKSRRPAKSLPDFISNGDLQGMDLLDGYAQSWALTYFLIETRPREYSKYLKLLSERPPFTVYTAKERLADFHAAFGTDLILFEAKFLRFIEQLR